MYIEKIKIKNFRSIVDVEIEAKNITVFVGKNDAGKSNILRALNLFFNNQTDTGQNFEFETDFSRYAIVQKKKAKEIEIIIYFSPPETFKGHLKKILWKRVWRKDGLYERGEKIFFADGKELTDRSRLKVWLKRLQYHYVPAIKSNDYFGTLLKKLYETLYSALKNDLQEAGKNFVNEIRHHTELLSDELFQKLSFESKIQLTENLSNLFSTLDFETKNIKQSISLKNRGDGIKVRHFPVILKFLAEKERMHHAKGAVRSDTIWGYEEPENNLELFQAFQLAKDFENYSNDIQIFLTTHSPAFYTIGKNQQKTIKYNSYKENDTSLTKISRIEIDKTRIIDQEMGLMQIVAPYIEEKVNENQKLLETIEELKNNSKPVLFVEGPTDKIILENAWIKIRNNSKMPFRVEQAYDRSFIGNTFSRCDIFKNDDKRLFLGLLDFDEAFENWNRLLESKNNKNEKQWNQIIDDPKKGLLIKHNKYKAFLFLIPVPKIRKDYANQKYGKISQLSIELLFADDKLKNFIEEKELPGNVKIIKMKDNKKTDFAILTNNFCKEEFCNFEPIFNIIEKIVNGELN